MLAETVTLRKVPVRKLAASVLLGFLFVALLPQAVEGGQSKLSDLLSSAAQHLNSGNDDAAFEVVSQALDLANSTLDQDPALALQQFQQLRKFSLSRFEPDSDLELLALDGLAESAGRTKDLLHERGYLQEYLGATTRRFGDKSEHLADPYWRLGLNLYHSEEIKAAILPVRRSMELHVAAGNMEESINVGHGLAKLLRHDNRLKEAAQAYENVVKQMEAGGNLWQETLPGAYQSLARTYGALSRYAEAGKITRKALAFQEEVDGPNAPSLVPLLVDLAGIYMWEMRYEETRHLLERARRIGETNYGLDHSISREMLQHLAQLHINVGGITSARSILKIPEQLRGVVQQREQKLGPQSPATADAWLALAQVENADGNYAVSEQLSQRAAVVFRSKGESHKPNLVSALLVLSETLIRAARFDEAETYRMEAVSLGLNETSSDCPIEENLAKFGALYLAAKNFERAENLLKDAADGLKAKRCSPLMQAEVAQGLAQISSERSDYAKAEQILENAQKLTQEVAPLGLEMTDVLEGLAWARYRKGEGDKALVAIRQAFKIAEGREQRRAMAQLLYQPQESVIGKSTYYSYLGLLTKISEDKPQRAEALALEAVPVIQKAVQSTTAVEAIRSLARLNTQDAQSRALLARHQDLSSQLKAFDDELSGASLVAASFSTAKAKRDNVAAQMVDVDQQIQALIPEQDKRVGLSVLDAEQLRATLNGHEAAIAFYVAGDATAVLAISREKSMLYRAKMGSSEIAQLVKRLRSTLGADAARGFTSSQAQQLANLFDGEAAFRLYNALLRPLETVLRNKRTLYVVPHESLESLPFSALLTSSPKAPFRSVGDLQKASWMVRRHAITVLPNFGMLHAVSKQRRHDGAQATFLGVGDALFDGKTGVATTQQLYTASLRGTDGLEALRQLPRLPETATELKQIAQTIGPKDSKLILGADASEANLRSVPMGKFNVIAFATHGLMAGDFAALGEPALALTPPQQSTPNEDGLLSASEIARLELDADWVILSACNTAAPAGRAGAKGLSGLARAFFVAGARSLLVSQWAVPSKSTVLLTTEAVKWWASTPTMGRAEALRRSMLSMLDNQANPEWAHPRYWAPFVVVGGN